MKLKGSTSKPRDTGAPLATPLSKPRLERARLAVEEVLDVLEASPHSTGLAETASDPKVREAIALGKKDVAQGLRQLAKLSRDQSLAPKQRASAALSAARLTNTPKYRALAELFLAEAERLEPNRDDVARLRLLISNAKSQTTKTLKLADEFLTRFPDDVQVLRVKASALISDARVDEAVAVAASAVEILNSKPEVDVSDRVRCLCSLGFALTKANKPDEAVKVLKAALALDPENETAHKYIAEYVLPDLKDPAKRAPIEAKFKQANAAYLEQDYAGVKKIALEILAIDPNDGLAHKMFGTAADRVSDAKGDREVRAVFRDEVRCTALANQLEAVVKKASIKAESRPAQVKDLFPDWEGMLPWQKAVVADSVLAFGAVIPDLIEKGASFRFVPPGTSLCEVDPNAQIDKKKAFGRHSYSGRGWAYHNLFFVVTGSERLDVAARGGHNTITHEFAHLVHFYMRDLAGVDSPPSAPHPTGERSEALAQSFEKIGSLYSEAKARQDGQALLCSYSGTNVWEYFAQGMMAYLAPRRDQTESPNRLHARNPKLFDEMAALVKRLEAYPAEVPAPSPPPSSTEAGSVSTLLELGKNAKHAHVKQEAQSLWHDLFERVSQLEKIGALSPLLERTLARVAELERIDVGTLPPNHLGDPEAQVAQMAREALMIQARRELHALGKTSPQSPVIAALQKLHQDLAKNEIELDVARQKLLSLRQGEI